LTPAATRPGTPPPQRPTPVPGTPPQQRPPTPNRASTPNRPTTPRTDGTPPPAQRAAPVLDERAALQDALELIGLRDWSAARQALHALAARVPQSKPYRALLCYTRGREAQAAGKIEDAGLEFQRALQLDPELVQAKLALADIKRR
jgi:predicted Zn-dependent protease